MAEINIERKPPRSSWPLVIALLVVVALAAGVWYFAQDADAGTRTLPPDTAISTVPPGG